MSGRWLRNSSLSGQGREDGRVRRLSSKLLGICLGLVVLLGGTAAPAAADTCTGYKYGNGGYGRARSCYDSPTSSTVRSTNPTPSTCPKASDSARLDYTGIYKDGTGSTVRLWYTGATGYYSACWLDWPFASNVVVSRTAYMKWRIHVRDSQHGDFSAGTSTRSID